MPGLLDLLPAWHQLSALEWDGVFRAIEVLTTGTDPKVRAAAASLPSDYATLQHLGLDRLPNLPLSPSADSGTGALLASGGLWGTPPPLPAPPLPTPSPAVVASPGLWTPPSISAPSGGDPAGR